MNKVFPGCRIECISWGKPLPTLATLTFDVVTGDERFPVYIQNSNAPQQLFELFFGERSRAIFVYGMADIDIWKLPPGEGFRIEWSPCDGCFYDFFVDDTSIQVLVDSLKENHPM